MSGWDAWTKNLQADGIAHCGIYDLAGNPWTASELNLSQQEAQKLHSLLKNKDDMSGNTDGVHVNGEKWTLLTRDCEEGWMNIKGKQDNNREKNMTIAMCGQCMVLGANRDSNGPPAGVVCSKVSKLQKQLKDAGY